MSHLGFGGKVFYGAPDIDILMPPGTINRSVSCLIFFTCGGCNDTFERAQNTAEAIGSCNSTHGGHGVFENTCGDYIRRAVLDGFENARAANKPHDVDHPDGFPTFSRWPKRNDLLHQMMWVDWLKRAYEGGLRAMVALTVNSITFAKGVNGIPPYDDHFVGDVQLSEIKHFVDRHAWMEIAYSANDLRRIVGEDKLAVILGVELDDIGSFVWNKRNPTEDIVREEIRRLYIDKGVRYIFPVHVIDNYFGGTAIYEGEFARANRHQFGAWLNIGCANTIDGIGKRFETGWNIFKTIALGDAGGTQPLPSCPPNIGYVNNRGLTDVGRIAIDEMMRLGMIIDIDHMSQKTVQDTLTFTRDERYPLVSGHNGLRSGSDASENSRTLQQYQEIAFRSGIAGVGWESSNAVTFRIAAETVANTGIPISLGTDINGFAATPNVLPACYTSPCVQYSSSFPKANSFGKSWNYNIEGVAHYGLLPDFLRDVEIQGGQTVVDQLFSGAEFFARTWETTEWVSWVIKLWDGATPDSLVANILL
jgi:microsomal dipeptidase-like Zn-dependent dipeptidase